MDLEANIAVLTLRTLAADPQRIAVVERDGQPVTNEALVRQVRGVAWDLSRRGVSQGDRAVLQMPNGVELTATTLALLAVGAVPILCEPGLGDEVYLARMQAADAKWVIATPLIRALGASSVTRNALRHRGVDLPPPPAAARIVLSRRRIDALARRDLPDPGVGCRGSDEAAIVFTSGTTHAPRGVVHTHGSLAGFNAAIGATLNGLEASRILTDTLPQVLYALGRGRTAYITPRAIEKRARYMLNCIRRGEVDAHFGSPYVWTRVGALAGGVRLPPTLRTVLLGSAPVTPRFLEELRQLLDPQTAVASIYGLTEAGPVCAATLDDKLGWQDGGDLVGRPIGEVRLTIDAPPGEVGEVMVSGPSVCAGYLGEPPLDGAPLRTGDLGRLVFDDTGEQLVLLGRTKDMIIRRGTNIYPPLVEGPLLRAAARAGVPMADCAVVGEWSEARHDELVVLFAVPAGGAHLDPRAVAKLARGALGADFAPDRVIVLDELPVRGRQNKRDMAALRAIAAEHPEPPPSLGERLHDAVVPFGFSEFAQKYWAMLAAEDAPAAVLAQAAFRLTLWGVAQTTWALDEIVAPDWRGADGLGPLFILGHQRSGTTLLHRLLAQDATHARSLTLQEMLLPAVSFQGLVGALDRLDRRFGRPVGGRIAAWEDRALAEADRIHRIRLEEVEEDEFVLWAIFASIMCANDAPSSVAARDLEVLREFERWPQERQLRVLGYYRDVLRRKLYRDGQGRADARWVVAKNPAFSQKIPALTELFEDARFIYLVRNPLEAIPSRLSMLREIWHRRFPGFTELTPAHVEPILEDSYRTYLYAERDLPRLDERRRLVVRYEELRADAGAVVHRIYEHFGLPGPDAALEAAVARLRNRGAHEARALALEDFFLDEARLRRDLAPVFDQYGY